MTVGSFFRQVFLQPSWTAQDLPSLEGKVAIVTGSTSGIGVEIVRALATKNCHVYLVARSSEKARQVIQKLNLPSAKLDVVLADFMDLNSVVKCAQELKKRCSRLDILINNAGIISTDFITSKQDIESTFAVNYFATVVFTNELLPVITQTPHSRIVILSSLMHVFASGVAWNTIQEKEQFSREMYSRTKLALILYSRELQTRLTKHKVDSVYVNSCHPGLVRTEMFDANYKTSSLNDRFMRFCAISPAKGAITPLYAAADDDIQRCGYKGQYFVPFAHLAYPSEQAQNAEFATEAWTETAKMLQKYYKKDYKLLYS